MAEIDRVKFQAATAVFKLGVKAKNAGVHRALNRAPKGTGWVQCRNSPMGVMCKPDKVKKSIGYFKEAYEIFPDIVALNQIALSYEMIGEFEEARTYFMLMKRQAERENISVYVKAAEFGFDRVR